MRLHNMSQQTVSLDRYEPPVSQRESSSSTNTPSPASGKHRRHSSLRRRTRDVAHSSTHSMASGSRSMVQTEQTLESSIRVLIWDPNAGSTSSSSSSSALARTPILRDVPQVKRKLGRRDRDNVFAGNASQLNLSGSGSSANDHATQSSATSSPSSFTALGSPTSSISTFSGLMPLGPSDYRSVIKNAAPSWLREKPSKTRLNATAPAVVIPQNMPGAWRRATMVCRETGVLLFFGEDNALLHSIATTSLDASDVRIVEDSLFCRPNVLGIFSRPSSFNVAASQTPLTPRTASTSQSRGGPPSSGKDDPLFLCFGTTQKMLRWRVLLRSFARPEIYGPTASAHRGGTHRIYRQVDASILEAKVFAERPTHSFDRSRRQSSGQIEADSLDSPSASHNTSSFGHGMDASLHQRRSSDASGLKALSSVDDGNQGRRADKTPASNEAYSPGYARPTPEVDRRPSQDYFGVSTQIQSASCFCQVWRAGEVVARTRLSHGTPTIAWFEKFSLRDLPSLSEMHIEVLQAYRNGKGFFTLGFVDVPLETMRRGDTIEGWFPIWSPARGGDVSSRYLESTASYSREMVGEIKLSMNVREEHVLALKRYAEIEAAFTGPHSVDLMLRLSKELDEDRIVSHLVDIFAASGTIPERFTDLTIAESSHFASEQALLFRGNTLLSRSIDKYQRRYCTDWLDACVGPLVRRICAEQVYIEPGEQTIFGAGMSSPGSSSMTSDDSPDSSAELLKRLCNELWVNIYAHRHKCPVDLRKALHVIRTEVNVRFDSSPGPGVQSVGAFVFLRLICPAITTPNLYGLMGHAPDAQSARTLMLIAKVFLALANKRMAFNRDKEPWLTRLDDFLERHATAYDDFITTISTPPESSSKFEPLGDEADSAFQMATQRRIEQLPALCREALPLNGVMYDHALSLASLVGFVVRNAPVDAHIEPASMPLGVDPAAEAGGPGGIQSLSDDEYYNFIDMCCDVEDMVGYHIDRAGLHPRPIDISLLSPRTAPVKSTSIYAANKAPSQTANEVSGKSGEMLPQKHIHTFTSVDGIASDVTHPQAPSSPVSPVSPQTRRATVSGSHRVNEPSVSYSHAEARISPSPTRGFGAHSMASNLDRHGEHGAPFDDGMTDRAAHPYANDSASRRDSERLPISNGGSALHGSDSRDQTSSQLSYDDDDMPIGRARPAVDDRASFVRSPHKPHLAELLTLQPAAASSAPEPRQKRGWWRRKA